MTITRTFTDQYGITYTDTQLYVATAGRYTTQIDAINVTTDYVVTSNPATQRITYTMCWWATPQAKTDGLQSFAFQVDTGQTALVAVWHFDLTSDYDGLSIQDACEKHFRNYVFPDGQPAGQYNPTTLV